MIKQRTQDMQLIQAILGDAYLREDTAALVSLSDAGGASRLIHGGRERVLAEAVSLLVDMIVSSAEDGGEALDLLWKVRKDLFRAGMRKIREHDWTDEPEE